MPNLRFGCKSSSSKLEDHLWRFPCTSYVYSVKWYLDFFPLVQESTFRAPERELTTNHIYQTDPNLETWRTWLRGHCSQYGGKANSAWLFISNSRIRPVLDSNPGIDLGRTAISNPTRSSTTPTHPKVHVVDLTAYILQTNTDGKAMHYIVRKYQGHLECSQMPYHVIRGFAFFIHFKLKRKLQ